MTKKKKLIIYIDDNSIDLVLFYHKIIKHNFNCLVFHTVASAKEFCNAYGKSDLIVCDINGTSLLDLSFELSGLNNQNIVLTSATEPDNKRGFPFRLKDEIIPYVINEMGEK